MIWQLILCFALGFVFSTIATFLIAGGLARAHGSLTRAMGEMVGTILNPKPHDEPPAAETPANPLDALYTPEWELWGEAQEQARKEQTP